MYLARHCGWDKDFIAERFTLGQIKIYFEQLNKMDIEDTKRMAVAFRVAQMKDDDFKNFLSDGDDDRVVDKQGFDQMKADGLPVEEI